MGDSPVRTVGSTPSALASCWLVRPRLLACLSRSSREIVLLSILGWRPNLVFSDNSSCVQPLDSRNRFSTEPSILVIGIKLHSERECAAYAPFQIDILTIFYNMSGVFEEIKDIMAASH